MSGLPLPDNPAATRSKFHYGWVVVSVGTLMLAITYGLMYSYSVFFKPLADYFSWDRATVSSIYSASLVIRGAISIGVGWLADRYGSVKLMVVCSFLIGLGLVLSSQVQTLWQFFVTYALIEAIGLSGTFGIVTALTSRWFTRNRGLALGIVSSGVGLGTLIIVPGTERLIDAFNWSQAFIICGFAAGGIMIISSLFLRPAPQPAVPGTGLSAKKETARAEKNIPAQTRELNLAAALREPRMIIMISIFGLLIFCTQLVLVHLVNYATDMGITPLVAASFVSLIGLSSVGGRLAMGAGADRLGLNNTLIMCCLIVVGSLVCLLFTRAVWSFYVFAVFYGFAYGGEVPQIPLFVGKFCGTKAMATLVGLTLFVGNIGGALGPWVGGKIFDLTSNYHWAFIVGIIVALMASALSFVLKRQSQSPNRISNRI
jgi:MFS family permease